MKVDYANSLRECYAVIPAEVGEGVKNNGSWIYSKDGTRYVKYSVAKVLQDYCLLNYRDYKSLIKTSREITNRSSNLPLYIKSSTLFMPFKSMVPEKRGHICMGYVNYKYVEEINFKDKEIRFCNNTSIKYIETDKTIKQRVAECVMLDRFIAME